MNINSITNKSMIALVLGLIILVGLTAQAQEPAPTLVPPTRVPTQPPTPRPAVENSGIYDMQNEGVMRVGARYNLSPFSTIDSQGNVVGYEAEIIEAIKVELGVKVEWKQITAENELDLLLNDEVDMLIGEQIITRDREQFLSFTHPYYLNKEMMVVIEGTPYQDPHDLAGLPVSVAANSPAERGLQGWIASGVNFDVRRYANESLALDALQNGEVQAMVGQLDTLLMTGRTGLRFIDAVPIQLDSYAIAVRRHDINLRNILNRSIQRLYASNRMNEIYQHWFPDTPLDLSVLIPTYTLLYEDARTLADLNWDIPAALEPSIWNRLQSGEQLVVVGLNLAPDTPPMESKLDNFYRALIDEMARRWGVTVNYVPGSTANKLDLLFGGQAMIAAGVTPTWDGADRFEYSRPYAFHGNQMLVLEGSRFGSFQDFRGGSYIGYWFEDTYAPDEINRLAEYYRTRPTPYELRSISEIVSLFGDRTLSGIFGDTLRLYSIIDQAQSSGLPLKLLDQQYSKLPLTFALPRNDLDFLSIVDWTLQDMYLDGTYQRIYQEQFGFGDPIVILTWPGSGDFLKQQE